MKVLQDLRFTIIAEIIIQIPLRVVILIILDILNFHIHTTHIYKLDLNQIQLFFPKYPDKKSGYFFGL